MKKVLNKLFRSFLSALLVLNLSGFGTVLLNNVAHAANPSADLDQWANLDNAWQNGNLGQANSAYREGDSVPYRLRLANIPTSGTHTIVIEWDVYKSGTHALDYVTSYNRTVSPNPCSGVAGCGSPAAFPIPADTQSVTPFITQIPGNLTLYNGIISSVVYSNPQVGDARSMTITFTASTSKPVLAWGGHIASQIDWGFGNSASAINGSPYHMRLLSLDGSGGNQDRSLSAAAIYPTPAITTNASLASIYLGQSVADTATVAAVNSGHHVPVPAGSVAFYVCGPSGSNPDCSSGGTQVGSSVNLASGHATSTAFTPSSTGKYCFRAQYTPSSGSPYSPQIHTNQTTECFTVLQGTSTVTLIKTVNNNNGGTAKPDDFNLTIGGQPTTSGTPVTVNAGTTVAINETQLPGYSFVKIEGTGCPKVLGGTITVGINQNITCTITNDDIAPTIKLVKTVVNNNGGTKTAADFQGKLDGSNVTWGTVTTTSAGSHAASETNLPGYKASVWGGDCNADGSISLALGQNAVCTITNDDVAPSLTLNKIVANNHGGTAHESDWTLTATGPSMLTGEGAEGDEDVVSGSDFKAGTYTLSESGTPTGYSASAWTCTNDVVVTNNQITLANGQTTVCTITNTDVAPGLTILKLVENPYGTPLPVSSFPLYVDSTQVTSGVKNTQFNAGTHSVSETQQAGYILTDVSGDCKQSKDLTISVLLTLGQDSTCTLTNTAIQPKLTVIKHVINDNGGTNVAGDFTMTVSENSQTVPDFPGSEAGTTVGLNEGSYLVDEVSSLGYAKTLSDDCSGTITIGQTKTCTITNDDVAPSLTLNKIVANNHGGTAHESDWALTATGPSMLTGEGAEGDEDVVSGSDFKAGTYTLSESGTPTGYSASAWTCTNDVVVTNNQITLANGQTTVCTITNTDVAPKLRVVKTVHNYYSGEKSASDFEIIVDGVNVSDPSFPGDPEGTVVTLDAGLQYTVTEGEHEGYTNWFSYYCSGTLALGETKTCYVENYDMPHPGINIVKSGPATAHEGDTVTYNFTVTNTGDTSLDAVGVFDSIAGDASYVWGDSNDNGLLDTTEVWHFTADYVIPTPQVEDVLNTGYVCADVVLYEGDIEKKLSLIDDGEEVPFVCDEDSHTLDVLHPMIKVVKDGPATAKQGETVTYTFTVTNTGDVALGALTVVDNVTGDGVYVSGDTNGNNMLDLTETWLYKASYTVGANQTGSVNNTVVACGNDRPRVILDELISRELIDNGQRACGKDDHSMQIVVPPVLVNTGEANTLTYTIIGLINTMIVVSGYVLTRRQQASSSK